MKLLKFLIVALSVMFFSVAAHAGDKIKVGFIYVALSAIMDGPIDMTSEDLMLKNTLVKK